MDLLHITKMQKMKKLMYTLKISTSILNLMLLILGFFYSSFRVSFKALYLVKISISVLFPSEQNGVLRFSLNKYFLGISSTLLVCANTLLVAGWLWNILIGLQSRKFLQIFLKYLQCRQALSYWEVYAWKVQLSVQLSSIAKLPTSSWIKKLTLYQFDYNWGKEWSS